MTFIDSLERWRHFDFRQSLMSYNFCKKDHRSCMDTNFLPMQLVILKLKVYCHTTTASYRLWQLFAGKRQQWMQMTHRKSVGGLNHTIGSRIHSEIYEIQKICSLKNFNALIDDDTKREGRCRKETDKIYWYIGQLDGIHWHRVKIMTFMSPLAQLFYIQPSLPIVSNNYNQNLLVSSWHCLTVVGMTCWVGV